MSKHAVYGHKELTEAYMNEPMQFYDTEGC